MKNGELGNRKHHTEPTEERRTRGNSKFKFSVCSVKLSAGQPVCSVRVSFLLMFVFLFAVGGSLFAQEAEPEEEFPVEEMALPVQGSSSGEQFQVWKEYPWALGASLELGRNTRETVATGFGLSLDRYLYTRYLAAGLQGALHNDGNTISATEVLLNIRAYLPLPLDDDGPISASLFAQWGMGLSFYSEEGRQKNTYTMNALAGCRIYLNRGAPFKFIRGLYVEPYLRTGYPFLLGGGVAVGHWFNF